MVQRVNIKLHVREEVFLLKAFTTKTTYVPVSGGYVAVGYVGSPTEMVKLFLVSDDGLDEPYIRDLTLDESDVCELMTALNDTLPRYAICEA